ncbi:MAG: small multi-drug export protein [Coriobacteriia bacterium]|nr:small multi-drug export protein [Coriobacteriia bacterium]MBN2823650.1 small multi-drug export protein [Coriobacteriia bacterium]
MNDLLAQLPPYLKYVVLTWIPWIELRAAVPLAVQQGEQVYLPLILLANLAIFWPGSLFLDLVYDKIPEGSWLHRKLEGIRVKAHPLVEKYGVLGLAVFVAIPLPGTGAYSGTAAAWLLGMDRKKAFAGVSLGVLIAFFLVWALAAGVLAGVQLL